MTGDAAEQSSSGPAMIDPVEHSQSPNHVVKLPPAATAPRSDAPMAECEPGSRQQYRDQQAPVRVPRNHLRRRPAKTQLRTYPMPDPETRRDGDGSKHRHTPTRRTVGD